MNHTINEIRYVEERDDEDGHIDDKPRQPEPLRNPYKEYALVSRKRYDKNGQLVEEVLEINSSELCGLLDEIAGRYPGYRRSNKGQVRVTQPYMCIYHHRSDLEGWVKNENPKTKEHKNENPKTKEHIVLLLQFIDSQPSAEAKVLIDGGQITFQLLWTVFRPGNLLFTLDGEHQRLYYLDQVSYEPSVMFEPPKWKLHCTYADANGEKIGRARTSLSIAQNEFPNGPLSIESLSAYPLKHHHKKDEIREKLYKRGERFRNLQQRQLMCYDGLLERLELPPEQYFGSLAELRGMWLPATITGRIMVDYQTFFQDNASWRGEVAKWIPLQERYLHGESDEKRNDDLQTILFPHFVYGYSLQLKCWCKCSVELFSPVRWKMDAFDSLCLDPTEKELILSLAETHEHPTTSLEESMLKGKGLVMLFHGAPGTGKTLTAEAVAEKIKHPLLVISTGELGSNTRQIQGNLKKFMSYATKWGAVTLIDEADVFLEARQSGMADSFEKNALVAVFLRQLEYFHGIVFLTTNRISSFDEAIASRVHLTLKYSPPNMKNRRTLWKSMLEGVDVSRRDVEIETELSMLEKYEISGREISNAINLAMTLARHDGKKTPLQIKHISKVLKVWQQTGAIVVREDRSFTQGVIEQARRAGRDDPLRSLLTTLVCGILMGAAISTALLYFLMSCPENSIERF